ncbi:uncharacterized protein [Emydura macquarii macquarii]|uniref:uncharacterized protein n=1 Tax=Emydura macquarii macquarii TaxID=1129001 RepID=UPI003529FF44
MKSAGVVLLVALLWLGAELPAASGGDRVTPESAKAGYCYKVPPLGGVFEGESCAACLENKNCSTCCSDADCPGSAKCCPDECGYTCQGAVTDLCHLPSVCGNCKARFPRFFYNWSSQACEQFVYGGCGGNKNNFETLEECIQTCRTGGKQGRSPALRRAKHRPAGNPGLSGQDSVPRVPAGSRAAPRPKHEAGGRLLVAPSTLWSQGGGMVLRHAVGLTALPCLAFLLQAQPSPGCPGGAEEEAAVPGDRLPRKNSRSALPACHTQISAPPDALQQGLAGGSFTASQVQSSSCSPQPHCRSGL